MKEEDEGEELINLEEEQESNRNKKAKIEKSNFKNKSALFIISFLLILIIFIYLFKYYGKIFFQKQKTLIIFDFDKTITLKDVFEEQIFLLPANEEQEEIMDKLY